MEAIQLYDRMPDPLEAIRMLGEAFAKSGMFGCGNAHQGQILAMVCLSERKSPIEINRTYDILTDGKLRKKSMAGLAEFRKLGGKHKWIKTGDEPAANDDAREAVGEFTFEEQKITVRLTVAEARKRKYNFKDGSGWTRDPAAMLRARIASSAVGMLAPEIFAGEVEESDAPAGPPLVLGVEPTMPAQSATAQVLPSALGAEAKPVPATASAVVVEVQSTPVPPPLDPPAVPVGTPPVTTGDLVEQVATVIGADMLKPALAWMREQNPPWLADGQTLNDLPDVKCQRVLKHADGFMRAVRAWQQGRAK